MKNPCKICEPNICKRCGFHKSADEHPVLCSYFAPETLCAKHELLKKLIDTIGEFNKLELKPNERIECAQQVQKAVDAIRFRAGLEKECLKCRFKNAAEAQNCVKCASLFYCGSCEGETWRCQHGFGFKKVEEKKLKKKPAEPRVVKAPRERIIREVIEKRSKFVLVDG